MDTPENRQNYDLMSLILLRLGDESTKEKTLGMLQTLFLGDMKPMEWGITIYKTLLETGSVVKTAFKLGVSEQDVQGIANKFEVKLSE